MKLNLGKTSPIWPGYEASVKLNLGKTSPIWPGYEASVKLDLRKYVTKCFTTYHCLFTLLQVMHVEKKESQYHSKYVTALLRRYSWLH